MNRISSKIFLLLAALAPISLFAFSTGPPAKRTGAFIDGGTNCSVCHRDQGAANSDTRGSVKIDALSYTPGSKQTIKVTVSHPEAMRWGFQIAARLVNNPSKQAGTFTVNDIVRVRCDTTPAQDAPCNGANEFPEHNNAPRTAAGAGYTFSVDWTPPSTDQGDVVFYAAGNAANGDGNLTGDHIYTTTRVISPQCSNTNKPTITSIVNAGSFAPMLAANTMLTIFGKNFAANGVTRLVGADDIATYKAFPQQLACLAVEIDGKRAPISYLQTDQINVQAPATSSLGPVTVKVIANPDSPAALSSDAASAQLLAVAPAFFTLDSKNIAAQFANSTSLVGDPSAIPTAAAAKPGDIVVLYGTGFGPTTPAVAAGDLATAASPVTGSPIVAIGGVTVGPEDLLYIGLSPGSISGLYQLNLRIPATVPDGNAAVSVQIGGQKTQDGAVLAVKR